MANIVDETLSLELINSTYFKVVTTTYDDDSIVQEKTPIGDAATTNTYFANIFKQHSLDLAIDVRKAAKAATKISKINTHSTYVEGILGTNPLEETQAAYLDDLTASGWTIDDGTNTASITFSLNQGTGNVEYSISGGQNKVARVYGGVIVLKNFPSSPTDTQFFLSEDKTYFYSLPNESVKIIRP